MIESEIPVLTTVPAEIMGARVILRAHRPQFAMEMYAAIAESRQHLRPWMDWVDDHRSVDDTRAFCVASAADWLLRSTLGYSIFDRTSDRFLGGIGCEEIDRTLRSFAVGYWLRVGATGHGYATEATRLLVDKVFSVLGARRVQLTCDVRNTASRRVAERAGFVLEARMRNARLTPSGGISDTLMFSLTPEDRSLANQ
ncbi:MAG: GNAT family protein [Thermomicrobiales bacterium]